MRTRLGADSSHDPDSSGRGCPRAEWISPCRAVFAGARPATFGRLDVKGQSVSPARPLPTQIHTGLTIATRPPCCAHAQPCSAPSLVTFILAAMLCAADSCICTLTSLLTSFFAPAWTSVVRLRS
ncbi:hypothetical protein DAEQUDRAFT_485718 [Daedalea quercina L-15889]|uniref:Uncharacterized protein n=1 Tax=Daedalea quercina L-15889 TaxID=1314783 RepID=A0A165MT53_9APHY|nr:hypothetical protein DAEQUDRAFT_485718 [Daedalea quercina L-15889]